MLILARRLADDERQVLRLLQQTEMLTENGLQTLQGRPPLAIAFEPADPVRALGVFLEPGVGAAQGEHATWAEAPMHIAQKELRLIETIDEVGSEDQVVVAVALRQITGVALMKADPRRARLQIEGVEADFMIAQQIALLGQGIAQMTGGDELDAEVDEAHREVDAGHRLEMTRQLEAGTTGGTAEIEGALARSTGGRGEHALAEMGGKIGHREIALPIVKLEILRHQQIALVMRDRLWRQGRRLDVTQAGVLKKVPAESVAAMQTRLIAAGDPAAAFDQMMAAIEGRRTEVVIERMHLEAGKRRDRRLRPLPDIADDVEELAVREAIDRTGGGFVIEMQLRRRRRCRHFATGAVLRQGMPLRLTRQTQAAPRRLAQPAHIGARFMRIDLDRPVPWHVDLFAEQA